MATKAELLKHYTETLRREWDLESKFLSIRREMAVIAERKKMLEAALLNESEPELDSASRPISLSALLAEKGREMLRASTEAATPTMTSLQAVGMVKAAGTVSLADRLAQNEVGSDQALPGLVRRRRMGSDSLPAKILTWMEQFPRNQVHKAETICDAFSDEKMLVLDALRRLHDRRQIQRPARGLYQLIPIDTKPEEEAPM